MSIIFHYTISLSPSFGLSLSFSLFFVLWFPLLRLSTLNINGHFTGYYTERDNTQCIHTYTLSHFRNKGGDFHSFLKYKWAVNNVMMLSCSIYSYMICWLGFLFIWRTDTHIFIPWYGWEIQIHSIQQLQFLFLFSLDRMLESIFMSLSTMWMYKSHL